MSKYQYMAAVGQLTEKSCWAACLKWWYKAVLSINPSQQKLIDHYKSGICDPDGSIPDVSMQQLIEENAMVCFPFTTVSQFDPPVIEFLLSFGPVFTAYTESGTHKRHVNIIYELIGSEAWAEVRVMEPQAVKKGTGYIGKHQKKPISDFNMLGAVYAGVSRKAMTGL